VGSGHDVVALVFKENKGRGLQPAIFQQWVKANNLATEISVAPIIRTIFWRVFWCASLRLGLGAVFFFFLLDQCGKEEAQAAWRRCLDGTGRGSKGHIIAGCSRTKRGKSRMNALKAAKELLANPPAIDQPNRSMRTREPLPLQRPLSRRHVFVRNAQGCCVSGEAK